MHARLIKLLPTGSNIGWRITEYLVHPGIFPDTSFLTEVPFKNTEISGLYRQFLALPRSFGRFKRIPSQPSDYAQTNAGNSKNSNAQYICNSLQIKGIIGLKEQEPASYQAQPGGKQSGPCPVKRSD